MGRWRTACGGWGIGGSLVVLLGCGCGATQAPPEAQEAPALAAASAAATDVEAPSGIDELDTVDTSEWVAIYDPERAASGYNLVFHRRRIPMLIDMNGRVVHTWPEARAKSRLRLLPDGSLLTINLGRAVTEYGWDGEVRWTFRMQDEIPHHDVIRLRNGNTMLVIRRKDQRTDDILEVDRQGQVVWTWKSGLHLRSFFDAHELRRGEITHINSVQELPENPWFDAGDDRFRPGNLLISARNLNEIFIIDRQTDEVVWSYGRQLDMQHEALMIGPGLPGHGNILLFDNGYGSRHRYRRTTVLEIAPQDGEVTWEYSEDGFYSPTGGIEQPLPNGNILISSSRGGRVFELTRDKQIVWQWTPPFQPNRPRRIAYDFCPQLAALGRPTEIAVRPAADYRHVDPAVYQFTRRGGQKVARVNGQKRRVLANNNDCRKLFLPAAGRLEVAFGLNRSALRRKHIKVYKARFGLRLTELDSGQSHQLLDETLNRRREFRRRRSIDLEPFALRHVELCVETEALGQATGGGSGGKATEPFAYWSNPVVVQDEAPSASMAADEESLAGLTAEEIEVQKEHLRALGYID